MSSSRLFKPARRMSFQSEEDDDDIDLLPDIDQSVVLSLHLDRMSSPTYEISSKP